jgi:hypothetical protein
MANKTNYVVSGFQVSTFTVKKDKVKLVLEVDKDDLRAQDGTLSDVFASLEAHSSSEFPVELTLGRCDSISPSDE